MSDEVTRQAAERALALDAQTIQRMTEEVHRLKDAGEQLIAECNRVSAERDAARAEVAIVIAERDAAERERTESRAEVVRLMAECEGLRADLLAHPPELHQELAIERKQHLDLVEDYNRQVATITSLQSDLEKANKKASEAMEIEDRLHATLHQLEQCREERLDLRKKYAEIKNRHLVPDEIFGILSAIEANVNLAKSKIYSR